MDYAFLLWDYTKHKREVTHTAYKSNLPWNSLKAL